jgi:hypothetical protein
MVVRPAAVESPRKKQVKTAIITLVLTLALAGCDHIVKQTTPDAHKLVEAKV